MKISSGAPSLTGLAAWQTIDTAPKDARRPILLTREGPPGKWVPMKLSWWVHDYWFGWNYIDPPTHWAATPVHPAFATPSSDEPSAAAHGTARHPLPDTPATKQVIAELCVSTTETADLGDLVAATKRLETSCSLADDGLRLSFGRNEAADFRILLDALTAERARAEELLTARNSLFLRQEDLHRRAQAAESRADKAEAKAAALEKERDELKLKLSHAEPEALACDHWVDMFAKANARADKAEAEGVRARTAELAWEKHCKEAEKERDELKANWVPGTTWTDEIRSAVDELEDRFDIELYDEEHFRRVLKFMEDAIAKARKAEAEVATLKAELREAVSLLPAAEDVRADADTSFGGVRNRKLAEAEAIERLVSRTQAEGEG